ncbi:unnamed protein product [Didymodactylos carnosus]|uniref:Uncharacterized protein n=1 Tax=Didymodactylos carnosus TaxID=1234261 RepID=A0A815ZRK9_9BILA|nr:unnamed protein product [Didymodactylos carnosus]CAF1646881.1 unnamed protein product [Didymodactylos carnosus]CAF4455469.1 unnamed protein product [Didymodactylos carnosus]CAF4489651.1 unnamed protein product [Didymodactylos carnosus]
MAVPTDNREFCKILNDDDLLSQFVCDQNLAQKSDEHTELSTQTEFANKVSCCYYYLGRLLCDNNEEKTSHLQAALKNYPKTETNSYELTHCYILLRDINKNKSDFNEAIINYKSAIDFRCACRK